MAVADGRIAFVQRYTILTPNIPCPGAHKAIGQEDFVSPMVCVYVGLGQQDELGKNKQQ